MSIGKRIFEERSRLALSQAAFASAAGVSLSSQKRYENNERNPDMAYLDSLSSMGVDTNYVVCGVRDTEEWADTRAFKEVLLTVEMLLGLDESKLIALVEMAKSNHRDLNNGATLVDRSSYILAVQAWLKTASKPDACIDQKFLEEVMVKIEELPAKLSSAKKAKVVLMLYRIFKKSGEVDPSVIEDTVRIAGNE